MNDRQRDLFLYEWSRRRQLGQSGAALRGAIIGALGGLAFALVLMGETGVERGAYTGLSILIPMLERAGRVLVLSVPAFALLGYVLAGRVFASQEAMYQAIITTGARVPAQKPVMQGADRWPAIAVGVAFTLIAGFVVVLFAMYW